MNIYAPNDVNQHVTFFKELQKTASRISDETIIIWDDFNCTLSEIDKEGGNTNSWKRRVVEEINMIYGLNDICRFLNPGVEQFT